MAARIATADMELAACIENAGSLPCNVTQLRSGAGVQFDFGYLSPYFVTDLEHMRVVFHDVYVLVSRHKITSRNELLPLLEKIAMTGRPLVIVAEDVQGAALASLVVRNISKSIQVAAVRPSCGEGQCEPVLHEIARLTRAEILNEQSIQRDIQIVNLGFAKTIIIDKSTMAIESTNNDQPNLAMKAQQRPQGLAAVCVATSPGVPPPIRSYEVAESLSGAR